MAHLARRSHPRIEISHEAELLDTGGGVAHALPLLDDAFFVLNSDVFWLDGQENTLLRLSGAFHPERMDAVFLLQETATAVGYEGPGIISSTSLGDRGAAVRRKAAPYLFAGIQVLHRRLFDGMSDRVFSLVRLFDRAERSGRLQAIVHTGTWYHVGTLEALAMTRGSLAAEPS